MPNNAQDPGTALSKRQRRGRTLFVIGSILLLGSAPLLITLLLAALGLTEDPNPNPVFFGILAMITFWPSLVLMGIGGYLWKRSDPHDAAPQTTGG